MWEVGQQAGIEAGTAGGAHFKLQVGGREQTGESLPPMAYFLQQGEMPSKCPQTVQPNVQMPETGGDGEVSRSVYHRGCPQ